MDGDEDWLFRPILAGVLRYEALHDPKMGLEDFALINEALDVQQENQHRQRKHEALGRR